MFYAGLLFLALDVFLITLNHLWEWSGYRVWQADEVPGNWARPGCVDEKGGKKRNEKRSTA